MSQNLRNTFLLLSKQLKKKECMLALWNKGDVIEVDVILANFYSTYNEILTMEESKSLSAFTETFDSNLTTVLTTFLGFNEC